jgi:hypothetical protein
MRVVDLEFLPCAVYAAVDWADKETETRLSETIAINSEIFFIDNFV